MFLSFEVLTPNGVYSTNIQLVFPIDNLNKTLSHIRIGVTFMIEEERLPRIGFRYTRLNMTQKEMVESDPRLIDIRVETVQNWLRRPSYRFVAEERVFEMDFLEYSQRLNP